MTFENTEVWGFEHAIRGMRNPMNSWDKSDSCYGCSQGDHWRTKPITLCSECGYSIECNTYQHQFNIGENDLKLMQKLIRAGSEHRKFLRQIFISVDITAPMYWWSEFDTYKVGTTANSTSKMHKLASTPITLDCFEIDDHNPKLTLDDDCPNELDEINVFADDVMFVLENIRQMYIKTKDKRYWKELIRWLPESWLQTRTITMNYENVLTMYRQRKNHKLNEWSGIDNPKLTNFVGWVKTLPYAQELLLSE